MRDYHHSYFKNFVKKKSDLSQNILPNHPVIGKFLNFLFSQFVIYYMYLIQFFEFELLAFHIATLYIFMCFVPWKWLLYSYLEENNLKSDMILIKNGIGTFRDFYDCAFHFFYYLLNLGNIVIDIWSQNLIFIFENNCMWIL